ncbi:TPA: recombinase RecT, partial [Citrobacter freundii]
MTTNHPAHGPVSLERLHQIREILSKASAQSDGGNLGYAMADAVKVIDGVFARELVLMLSQAQVRNSTLWASDPRQQLAYLAVKRWARL